MRQTLPNINFASIRPLRGKQTDGFEQLSVQLFCGETEGQGEFFAIEGSGGDGGVEAYRERTTGEKIGLQSKFWSDLGDTQWRQLTKSVKTALRNHPELRVYVVSTPIDRNPTQTAKWKSLVKAWNSHARSVGIIHSIEFVWWGYSELSGLLSKSRYRDLLVYWLGIPDFNRDWLNKINRSHIALLGKRYSPKQHIETESGIRMEAFAWGDAGKARILDAFLKVSEHWRKIDRNEVTQAKTGRESKNLMVSLQRLMRQISSFRWPQSGYPAIRPLNDTCSLVIEACNTLERKLHGLNHTAKEKLAKKQGKNANYVHGPYDSLIYALRQLADTLAELWDATNLCVTADDSKLLLLGEAGSGKSHLIADLVTSAMSRSQPVLLLLGERYLGDGDPWTATIGCIGWNHSPDDLLAALDQEGRIAGRPALLCIDALNESAHRRLWQSHLIEFADRVSRFPFVKLLVSCRSDFARITLPEAIRRGTTTSWPNVLHQGYGTEVIEAIEVYFSQFRIQAPYFPPTLAEFRNPLFLRVFCEAFEGKALPPGPLGLDQVMRARIDRLCTQIKKEIDCDPEDTRAALMAIAKDLARNGGRPILRKDARAHAAQCFPNHNASASLYARLISNGILVETVRYPHDNETEAEVTVRFPYERFSDYFVALHILEGIDTRSDFAALFNENGRLVHLLDSLQYYENRGIARALAILVPERLGFEFAEVFTGETVSRMVLEDFLESLAWRSSTSFSKSSHAIFDLARESGHDLIPTYIRLSTIPQHPFNSEYLGERLSRLVLQEREIAWTIPVAELSVWSGENVLGEFLDWSFRAPSHLIPDEQALLAARLLLWFCTSNHRALRKKSTLAAIRLLVGRSKVVCALISELHSVDDPYLLERLYAVAAGVAMRLPRGADLELLGASVHQAVFARHPVTPNLLTRDFAASVLETCLYKGCLPKDIRSETFRPLFKSKWPKIPTQKQLSKLEKNENWRMIISSTRSEETGWYGDFGRYVMDAAVHYFSDVPLSESPPEANARKTFSGLAAGRWIVKRIEELGWSPEAFFKYERGLLHGRQRVDIEEVKLERISKKYQWIALREFLGFLSDHYWLNRSWDNEISEFKGAWQIYARDFDPSQRLIGQTAQDKPKNADEYLAQISYPNPFSDKKQCANRDAWVASTPTDFATIIQGDLKTDKGNSAILLAGHLTWLEPETDRIFEKRPGELKMWVDIRSFIFSRKNLRALVNKAKERHFYGHGCGYPENSRAWIGEYPWSEAYQELKDWCESPDERIGNTGFPYFLTTCQWAEGSSLIPSPQVCDLLKLEWSGDGARFVGPQRSPILSHLGGDAPDWGRPLLVEQETLLATLDEQDLGIAWCVVAERSCWCSATSTSISNSLLEVSALYWREKSKIKGGITKVISHPIPRRSTQSNQEKPGA